MWDDVGGVSHAGGLCLVLHTAVSCYWTVYATAAHGNTFIPASMCQPDVHPLRKHRHAGEMEGLGVLVMRENG